MLCMAADVAVAVYVLLMHALLCGGAKRRTDMCPLTSTSPVVRDTLAVTWAVVVKSVCYVARVGQSGVPADGDVVVSALLCIVLR